MFIYRGKIRNKGGKFFNDFILEKEITVIAKSDNSEEHYALFPLKKKDLTRIAGCEFTADAITVDGIREKLRLIKRV